MSSPAAKRENLWMNLAFCVVIPALILTQGPKRFGLDPLTVLLLGLAFPLGYAIQDYVTRRERNVIALIGIISVLLTGGIGLLKLPPEAVAIKEAAVPLLIGLMVLGTAGTSKPLVRVFLYHPQIFDTVKIDEALASRGLPGELQRLLRVATLWLAGSFLLSAILNFSLARALVRSPAGTAAFTEEIGKMTAWSWPVIVLPTMIITYLAFFRLIAGLRRATGLSMEELMAQQPKSRS